MTKEKVVEDGKDADEFRWDLLQKKAQTVRVGMALSLFRENGIEPILIKGWAAARYYPPDRLRNSIDIDFAVAAADFETATSVCHSPEAFGMAIDLHREMRHLDTVDWADLYENSQLVETETGLFRVLRAEDHLRVLCVHWLTDGAAHKDRLWDIYYVIENRPPDFDWDRFLSPAELHRRRWLICTVGLAGRYLGLDLKGTPIKDACRDLPRWLIKAVEREWAADTRHWPLESSINDPRKLARQILKRFRPNKVWATVQMEGSFDARTRIHYQIGSFFKRIVPSIRRVWKAMMLRRSE